MSLKEIIFLAIIFFMACSPSKKQNEPIGIPENKKFQPVFTTEPGVMVYKTNSFYRDKVPVILSQDKSMIISYPHPKDLMVDGKLLLPDILENGYFLDNKGIHQNTAFISLTYEEYSKLSSPPSIKEMMLQIKDKNPITELCDCGKRSAFTDITNQLNQLILDDRLKKVCKIIK
jgi:hypothetical protein